jgi:hypothetical protein
MDKAAAWCTGKTEHNREKIPLTENEKTGE